MAPGRGYLVYTGTGSHTLRLIEKDSPDEVDWIKFRTDGHPLPVYGPDGVREEKYCPVKVFRKNGLKGCISFHTEDDEKVEKGKSTYYLLNNSKVNLYPKPICLKFSKERNSPMSNTKVPMP